MGQVPQTILAVDDDPIFQEVVTLFLKDEYEVRHVTTGADALVRLRG
jgi:CheY-like chemotaxis protein